MCLDGASTDEESLLGLIEIPCLSEPRGRDPSPTGTYSYILLEDVILAYWTVALAPTSHSTARSSESPPAPTIDPARASKRKRTTAST